MLIKFTINTKAGSIKNISRDRLPQLIEEALRRLEKKIPKGPLLIYLLVPFQCRMMHIENLRATVSNLWQEPRNNTTTHM